MVKNIIITGHVNSDFDSLSSMFSVFVLLRNKVQHLFPQETEEQFQFYLLMPPTNHPMVKAFVKEQLESLFTKEYTTTKLIHSLEEQIISDTKYLVIVDTKRISRLHHCHPVLFENITVHNNNANGNQGRDQSSINKSIVVRVIDHHPNSDKEGDDLQSNDTNVNVETIITGAVTSVIVELLQKYNVTLTTMEATIMSLGIYEDTGSFLFGSTSNLEYKAMEYLSRFGLDHSILKNNSSRNISSAGGMSKFENTGDHEDSQNLNNYNRILTTLRENLTSISMLDNVIHLTQLDEISPDKNISPIVQNLIENSCNIHTLICIVRLNQGISVICRSSQDSKVNVGRICEDMGGGGHFHAASVLVRDQTISEIRSMLFQLLYGQIVGKDILLKTIKHQQQEVLTIDVNASIKSSLEIFTKNPTIKYLIVLKDGKYHGLLPNIDSINSKISHNAMVQDYMLSVQLQIQQINNDTTLADSIQQLVRNRFWLLPLSWQDSNSQIGGVITSTDILQQTIKSMNNGQIHHFESSNRSTPFGKHLSILQNNIIYNIVFIVLKDVAEKLNLDIYLIGNTIYKILKKSVDLSKVELVIFSDQLTSSELEESILEFLSKSFKKIKDKSTIKNNTDQNQLTIELSDSNVIITIQITTFVYYPKTQYYFTYLPSPIKNHCYRTNFTMNSLFVDIKNQNLYDCFDAIYDINEDILNLNHSNSFKDNPSSILKMFLLQYEFDLTISNDTKRYLKNAVSDGDVKKIEGASINEFLHDIFKFKKPFQFLYDLKLYGIWNEISPLIKIESSYYDLLQDILNWYDNLHIRDLKPDRFKILMLTFIKYSGNEKKTIELGKRLDVSEEEIMELYNSKSDINIAAKKVKKWIADPDHKSDANSLNEMFKDLKIEYLLFLMSQIMYKLKKTDNNEMFINQAPFTLFLNYLNLERINKTQ
ncbi:hypothetical protein DLAC_06867 [Tieghemostelium lacteum]|uniref:DDH domain-containing protein n=1 Tax=Tieghemostelium lacteum TaxID=361077 RepID=A0A151ZDL4_TIELA|nr:hypothetical protein DLAC_06867 [Tieghemostelium lacteum]|eukprot:KYQ92037.1 hypothetical protein DLAC_06867 [Tieghemostelium lacteum]